MRALDPVRAGDVERDGVRLHWEEFGTGHPTIVLLPTWSLVHSRHWKFQVPYFARHHRVVTFDGRGCGLSGRPTDPCAYGYLEFVADTIAVLDATETDRAVLAGLSLGAVWNLVLAAAEPERVLGVVCLAPSVALVPMPIEREVHPFNERLATTDGWAKYNRFHWLEGGYPDFLEFFFAQLFTEPHSTKQIEDFTGWAMDTGPVTLVTIEDGLFARRGEPMRTVCERITAPVLVIHGDEDAIMPHAAGAALAEITGGQLVTIAGGGHGVQARHPVVVNHVVERFVDGIGR